MKKKLDKPNFAKMGLKAFCDEDHAYWGVVFALYKDGQIILYLDEEKRELLRKPEVEKLMQKYLDYEEISGQLCPANEYYPGLWKAQIIE